MYTVQTHFTNKWFIKCVVKLCNSAALNTFSDCFLFQSFLVLTVETFRDYKRLQKSNLKALCEIHLAFERDIRCVKHA